MKTNIGISANKLVLESMIIRLKKYLLPKNNSKNYNFSVRTKEFMIRAMILNPEFKNDKINEKLLIIPRDEYKTQKKILVKEFEDFLLEKYCISS
jgi:hypothetical protein